MNNTANSSNAATDVGKLTLDETEEQLPKNSSQFENLPQFLYSCCCNLFTMLKNVFLKDFQFLARMSCLVLHFINSVWDSLLILLSRSTPLVT